MSLTNISTILLDMDGVIYRGNTIIPGVLEFLEALSQRRIRYAFATNSSVATAEQHRMRLRQIGIEVQGVIITSAWATRQHLVQHFAEGTRIFAMGSDALRQELFGDGFFSQTSNSPSAVVVGHDDRMTYETCLIAARAIRNGAHFIGTNPDTTVPSEQGIVPETGALLAFLSAATGVVPVTVGKPSPIMFDLALGQMGAMREETLVVGDRLDTDIAGARAAGLISALVLTGVTTEEHLVGSTLQPDYTFQNLSGLLDLLT